MIRYQDERAVYVDAIRARYLAGEISEAVFSASLRGAGGLSAEDIRHELGSYAPPERIQSFDERRLQASRLWMQRYICQ